MVGGKEECPVNGTDRGFVNLVRLVHAYSGAHDMLLCKVGAEIVGRYIEQESCQISVAIISVCSG